MMPDLITVEADGVAAIFVEVISRITATAGNRLAVIFHANLVLPET